MNAIDQKSHEVVVLRIDRNGSWQIEDMSVFLYDSEAPQGTEKQRHPVNKHLPQILATRDASKPKQLIMPIELPLLTLDVVFPVLHGPYGEDGSIQGMLKTMGIPFVGPGVLSAAAGMDKDVMKRLLRDASIPVGDFKVLHRSDPHPNWSTISHELGPTVFVKPANLGSSVGICKAENSLTFDEAINNAFAYDQKVLVERTIHGRELECAVLGNNDPIVSVVGEVIPHYEFYTYKAKYLEDDGAQIVIPADINRSISQRAQDMAIASYKAICCDGMARVDFFLQEDGKLMVNELNTIPGFTRISMYPKLWDASGIPYPKLIERLIQLGIERYGQEQTLLTQ